MPSSFLSPSSNHSHHSHSSQGDHVNQDLADAVRDSVVIKSKSPTPTYNAQPGSPSGGAHTSSAAAAPAATQTRGPALPSLNPLVPRRTPSPNPPHPAAAARPISAFHSAPSYHSTHSHSSAHAQDPLSPASPDLDSDLMITGQPALSSARLQQMQQQQQVQNPFEEDEVEPAGTGRVRPPGSHAAKESFGGGEMEGAGVVQPQRVKFSRAHTG
ncbi:hypothetical protein IAT38_000445 [Cryptococcus sp. DSM 104549]